MEKHFIRQRIQECVQELNLKTETLEQFQDGTVSFSALINDQQQEASAGSGNGALSEEKSWAECLEHAFFNPSRLSISSSSQISSLKSIQEIRAQTQFQKDGILKNLSGEQCLETVELKQISDSNILVSVPSEYVQIQKDKSRLPILPKTCSTSGYSFHQSPTEAISHGLFEVIERHQFSNLLIQKSGMQISIDSLPVDILSRVKLLEQKFEGEIRLLIAEIEFDVVTSIFVFYPKTSFFPIPQTAQKCKKTLLESIAGSLAEMEQILFLYTEEEQQEDLQVKAQMNSGLYDSLVNLEFVRQFPQISFQSLLSRLESVPAVATSLGGIVQKIEQKKYYPVFRIIHNFSNGCCVAQVFVPGFEKFNLIRLGHIVPIHGQEYQ